MTSVKRSNHRNKETATSKVFGKPKQITPKVTDFGNNNKNEKHCTFSANCTRKIPPRSNSIQKNVPTRNCMVERNKMQAELSTRDQTIQNLQRKLSSVQHQMQKLLHENMRLSSSLQQNPYHKEMATQQIPCSKKYAIIENRLHHYCESTKNFEKQLAEMENSVKAMKSELGEVRAKRIQSQKNSRISFVTPLTPCLPHSACCGSRTPPCGQFSDVCYPHHCNLKRSSSDQPLGDLKEQYSKLKEDFQIQTEKLVEKINKNLDSLVK